VLCRQENQVPHVIRISLIIVGRTGVGDSGTDLMNEGVCAMRGNVLVAIAGLVLLPSLFILTALLPERGIAIWFCLAGVVVGLALIGHVGTRWRCPKCGNVFAITPWTDLTSPHQPDSKRLRCPKCGEVSWAKAVQPVRKIKT